MAKRESRREERSSDSKRYHDWLYHARVDMLSADLLRANPACALSAAFHCQQCAEKALKAFVLFRTGRLVDGHNLTWLCKQAVGLDRSFTQWLDESAYLNHYYIETRYPADVPLRLDGDAVARVYAMTAELFGFICEELGFDHEQYEKGAGRI